MPLLTATPPSTGNVVGQILLEAGPTETVSSSLAVGEAEPNRGAEETAAKPLSGKPRTLGQRGALIANGFEASGNRSGENHYWEA